MTKISFLALLSLAMVAFTGCQQSSTTDSAASTESSDSHDDHDHGSHEGHDHDHDGHDHDAHDHDAHGHDAHDHDAHGHDAHGHDAHGHDAHGHDAHGHDAHGHDGHDHGDHDHETIDASAAGLSTDALVHLEKADAPKSLDEAIKKLTSMQSTIAGGFADDDVDSIHNELHEIGTLLEQTESLAKESDLDDEKKKQALAAIDTLFDAFGSVDAKLHGDEGAEYSEVGGDIDDAIKVLGGVQ